MAEPQEIANLLEFDSIEEVDAERVNSAFSPLFSSSPARKRVFALLERAAEVSEPDDSPQVVLDILVRLSQQVWLEGLLDVRFWAEEGLTVIDVLYWDGLAYHRLNAPIAFAMTLDSFVQAVAQAGGELQPLKLVWDEPGSGIQLRSTEAPSLDLALGSGPSQKPTLKVPQVHVPREAYRQHGEDIKMPERNPREVITVRIPSLKAPVKRKRRDD